MKQLGYIEHFNSLKDLEVINSFDSNDLSYIDMVVNDHSIWDNLSDRQFRVLTDKINSKDFNSYKMNYRIIVDQDPVGIVLTLVYNRGEEPAVDTDLNKTVETIQEFLQELAGSITLTIV